jgi:hypothetical protein
MNYSSFSMPPIRSSQNSLRSTPYEHFTSYLTASPTSTQTSVLPLTLPKLTDYFISSNDELYDLLDKDSELYCIVCTIEILTDSHRTLDNLQHRQERYMLEQFDLAIQNGLQGRLLPLDEHRQRAMSSYTTLSPRQTDDRSDLCDNQSVQSITPSPTPEARRLIDRLSDPDDTRPLPTQLSLLDRFAVEHPFNYIAAAIFTPVSSSTSLVPLCAICSGLRRHAASLTHHTPDCAQYICMICEVSQPGHYPADCPQRSPSVYHDALD